MSDITLISSWLGSGSINLFGMPFAGKDTQAELLAQQLNTHILGGGDILRNSTIPAHVKAIMDEGALIPTDDYINIVLPYLSKQEFSGSPLILSSVGRWHGEEEGVIEALTQSDHPLKAVIYLYIEESTLYERWQVAQSTGDRGQRADDAKGKLATRLVEFREKTLPVINYYRERGYLIEIDASQDIDTVNQQILSELANLASIAR